MRRRASPIGRSSDALSGSRTRQRAGGWTAIRSATGSYLGAFVIAGGMCVVAALMSLAVGTRRGGGRLAQAPAA